MKKGDVFKTNRCGDVVVIEYLSCFNVKVKFLDTGNECITTSDQLKKGTVKDRFLVTLCGVGMLGEKVPYVETIYTRWSNMIKRCYDPLTQDAHPTYKGCTVCDEWLVFSNYHRWYVANYVDGFEVDKDKKIKGNKVYSPETCVFISKRENMQIAFQKEYRLTKRDGSTVKARNLTEFCRDNGLTLSCIRGVMSGKRKTHKDFIKVELIK